MQELCDQMVRFSDRLKGFTSKNGQCYQLTRLLFSIFYCLDWGKSYIPSTNGHIERDICSGKKVLQYWS